MLSKKYYTLADSRVTKRLTKLSTLNLNLPSYKIKNNEIDHDDIHFILVMKNYQDANTFKILVKHEYPIIQMDLVDILIYCENTKNNILIANNIDFNKDKILMKVNFYM